MANAKDIMSKNPVTFHLDQKFREALEVFQTKKFTSFPVIGSQGEVLGLMTEMAFLRAIVICRDRNTYELSLKDFQMVFEPVQIVSTIDPLESIVTAMTEHPTRRVVVVDEFEKVVGFISPKDLIRVVAPAIIKSPSKLRA